MEPPRCHRALSLTFAHSVCSLLHLEVVANTVVEDEFRRLHRPYCEHPLTLLFPWALQRLRLLRLTTRLSLLVSREIVLERVVFRLGSGLLRLVGVTRCRDLIPEGQCKELNQGVVELAGP